MRPRRAARRPRQHLLLPGPRAVIVVYAATAIGGELCIDDECLESAEFDRASIPWDELAFRSTHEGLRDYLSGARHPDIRPDVLRRSWLTSQGSALPTASLGFHLYLAP